MILTATSVNNLGATAAALVGVQLPGDRPGSCSFLVTLLFWCSPKSRQNHRRAQPGAHQLRVIVLAPLLKLLYPFVVLVSGMSNFVLRPFLRSHNLPAKII